MILWFKHMAVRLWSTLLIGSLAILVFFPPLAAMWGAGWMIVPALLLFVVTFWVVGMIFAALGRHRVARLINEAAVWDRAGMAREARQTLMRAEATVDSFLFSPFSRRVPAGRLLTQTAHFQLAQPNPGAATDAVIGAYLDNFPRDRDAAVKWLDRLLAGRPVTRKTHEIAAGIGTAHPDDAAIQRMLAQFYLAERRCDFAALQAYRQLVEDETALSDKLLRRLSDLFLGERRVDNLALQVYLMDHRQGNSDRHLQAAMAACCRLIHPTPLTRPLLERAEAALAGLDPARRQALAADFGEHFAEPAVMQRTARRRPVRPAVGPAVRQTLAGVIRDGGRAATGLAGLFRRLMSMLASRKSRATAKWTVVGLLGIVVGWLVVNTILHLSADFQAVKETPAPVVVPVTDPFTLQVAAYLKDSDALRFVEQLKGQGLDAYWTRATGGSKTWYQVRISHYATKAAARAVGEDLKQRRIIGDFYVANYKRPETP